MINEELFKSLVTDLRKKAQNVVFNLFENENLVRAETVKHYTGLEKEKFINLVKICSSMRTSENRSKSQALALYLFQMKTG